MRWRESVLASWTDWRHAWDGCCLASLEEQATNRDVVQGL
jgi:hypothetical protein